MGPALQALSVTFGDSSPRGRAKRDGWKKAGGWDAIPPLGVFAQLGVSTHWDFSRLGVSTLGVLLSLGFAQPMMLPYWSTTTLVPSGRVTR